MPVISYTSVSRTAARALEEFREDFAGALVLAEPELWAGDLGLVLVGDALKTTFPIPLDAAGYHAFEGDMKYRTLYSRALSMTSKKWQDGVKELAEVVERDTFIGWANQPAKMAMEWRRLPNVLAAQMLEANPILDFYKNPDTGAAGTRRLFADDHPCNVLETAYGTFDNDRSTTVADIRSGKFFEEANEYYANILGPNGQPMGLQLDGGSLLTNLSRKELFKKALEQDNIINAVNASGVPYSTSGVVAAVSENNLHKGTVKRIVSRELTSTSNNYVYTFASGLPDAYPFVIMQGGTPEEFVHDKSSELYKNHLQIALSYVGDANVAAALPHVVCRWTIS